MYLDVAHALSSQFYSFDMMPIHTADAPLSIKQFVTVVLVSKLLSHSGAGNAVICGWSSVSIFAFHAALELGVFLVGPRAVFAFYSRAQPLFRNKFAGAVPFASDSKPSFMLQMSSKVVSMRVLL